MQQWTASEYLGTFVLTGGVLLLPALLGIGLVLLWVFAKAILRR